MSTSPYEIILNKAVIATYESAIRYVQDARTLEEAERLLKQAVKLYKEKSQL